MLVQDPPREPTALQPGVQNGSQICLKISLCAHILSLTLVALSYVVIKDLGETIRQLETTNHSQAARYRELVQAHGPFEDFAENIFGSADPKEAFNPFSMMSDHQLAAAAA